MKRADEKTEDENQRKTKIHEVPREDRELCEVMSRGIDLGEKKVKGADWALKWLAGLRLAPLPSICSWPAAR